MPSASLDAMQELEALRQALEISERVVREGGAIDFHNIDEQVEQLCKQVVKTEGPLRLTLLPKLEEVIQVLDRLEMGLRQYVSPEGREAHNRIRARSAYASGTADASPSVKRTH
jgi:hypothetical protein